jgi:uncharacterized protein
MDVYWKEVNSKIGLGVFAARRFQKGEVVLRPTGCVLDHQTIYSIQIDWDRHLDPDPPAKYLNHSCDPNLGVHTGADGLPVFIALREIQPDEQVTFHYGMTEYMHYPRSDSANDFALDCWCESPDCQGRLGYYSELSQELKDKYQGFIADFLVSGSPPEKPRPACLDVLRQSSIYKEF